MLLSVMGITLEEIEISAALPINPTIIRIMRVLRIARGTYFSKTLTSRVLQALSQRPAKPFSSVRNRTLADFICHIEATSHETLLHSLLLLSVEAPEDGDRDASPVGYSGSSSASGKFSRILFFFFFCLVAGTSSTWVSHMCHSMLAWHVHTQVFVSFSARLPNNRGFLKQPTVHLMAKSMFVWVF